MNIIKRELQANLKSMLLWSIGIIFLIVVWMIEFESFASNPAINDFMGALPSGLLSAMGMKDLTLTNLEGFIGTIVLYLYLLLGIQAILLGSTLLSKEEKEKTAEFLFAFPITRKFVILHKTLAAIIQLIILNGVGATAVFISTWTYEKGANFNQYIALIFIAVLLIQLLFFSVGLFVSSINKQYKITGNIAVGILMVTFLLSSLISMVEQLDFLRFLTPFQYHNGATILTTLSLEPLYVVLSLVIIIASLVGTFIVYPKRDLYI